MKKPRPGRTIARGEFRGVDAEIAATHLARLFTLPGGRSIELPSEPLAPGDVLQITETDVETGQRSITEVMQPRNDVLQITETDEATGRRSIVTGTLGPGDVIRITETDEETGRQFDLEISPERPLGRPRGRLDTGARLIPGHTRQAHAQLAVELHHARATLGWRGTKAFREVERRNPAALSIFKEPATRELLRTIGPRPKILLRIARQFGPRP